MSKTRKSTLVRKKPEMAQLAQQAQGDIGAAGALEDAIQEVEAESFGALMIQDFEIGKQYWIETPIWVYIGTVIHKGMDYLLLDRPVRMHSEGRHHEMIMTGRSEGMTISITGGPSRRTKLPLDWIGPSCEWPFSIPEAGSEPSTAPSSEPAVE